MNINAFESYVAQDLFIYDIYEKLASDWKEAQREPFTRENFKNFVMGEFAEEWVVGPLDEWLDDEFSEEDDEDEETEI